jgi:trigger factor
LSVAGVEIKDAGGEGLSLELGSSQVLPELDAALTGTKPDQELDVEARFPEEHPRKELAGKAGTFHVKVKDTKARVLPALDDEFAKDVGSCQTLVELRANVHTELEKMLRNRSDTALAEQIVVKLNDKNTIELPPSLVERQCQMLESELLQNARRMGQRPSRDDFAKIHDQIHADAERKVRAGLLMAAIARKNGMVVNDDDIQKALLEIAEDTGKNAAKVRAEYADPQRRQVLIGMILEDKVLNLIESKAHIVDDEPAAAQAGV